MPLPLNAETTIAKNALDDDGVFLLFLEVTLNDGTKLYFVRNTEDVTWNGQTWQALAIIHSEIEFDVNGKLPEINLSISNVSRVIQNYVESDPDYGSGWKVKLFIVHTDALANNVADITLDLTVLSVEANELTVTFTLGVANPTKIIVPKRKCIPDYCQAVFKDSATGCTYTGAATSCGKSLKDCETLFGRTNDLPFLAFPSMPAAVLRV